MELQRKIEHYREYLKMYGSMICDLANSDEYIIGLIEDKNLDKIDTALRIKIELVDSEIK